jgi:hypothetical protein
VECIYCETARFVRERDALRRRLVFCADCGEGFVPEVAADAERVLMPSGRARAASRAGRGRSESAADPALAAAIRASKLQERADARRRAQIAKLARQARESAVTQVTVTLDSGEELRLLGRRPEETLCEFSIDAAIKAKKFVGEDTYNMMKCGAYKRAFAVTQLGAGRGGPGGAAGGGGRTKSWVRRRGRRSSIGSDADTEMTWARLQTAQAIVPGGNVLYEYVEDERCGCCEPRNCGYWCCAR